MELMHYFFSPGQPIIYNNINGKMSINVLGASPGCLRYYLRRTNPLSTDNKTTNRKCIHPSRSWIVVLMWFFCWTISSSWCLLQISEEKVEFGISSLPIYKTFSEIKVSFNFLDPPLWDEILMTMLFSSPLNIESPSRCVFSGWEISPTLDILNIQTSNPIPRDFSCNTSSALFINC